MSRPGIIGFSNPAFCTVSPSQKSEIFRKNIQELARFEEIPEKLQTVQLVRRSKRLGLSSSCLTLVLNKLPVGQTCSVNHEFGLQSLKYSKKSEEKSETCCCSSIQEKRNQDSLKETQKSATATSGFFATDSKCRAIKKLTCIENLSLGLKTENSTGFKRSVRTTVSAARFRKNHLKNKESSPQFPLLQLPLRMKREKISQVASKSFADLKSLPIHRLSIESNVFSRIRKYRGMLQ